MDDGGNRQTAGAVPDAIDALTRSIHLAMVVCGMAALMSGQFAGDYKSADHGGFVIHRWCGIAMALVMLVYVARGLSGAAAQRFSSWIPFNRRRLQSVWQDVLTLTRLQLPERPLHGGLAGLVQAAGKALPKVAQQMMGTAVETAVSQVTKRKPAKPAKPRAAPARNSPLSAKC